MQKEIYLIRHGETDLNRRRVVQGSGVDSMLNELGRQQAQAFYEHYHPLGFELVVTSKLLRTHETVAPFLVEQEPDWLQYAEINEISWGKHEGKSSTEDMKADYERMVNAWNNGDFDARLDDWSESANDMRLRLNKFISALETFPQERILVCSHGRAMRALVCLLEGVSLTNMEGIHHANTGLYLFHQTASGFVCKKRNDITHLEKAGLLVL